MILSAGYALWLYRRVVFGRAGQGEPARRSSDMSRAREGDLRAARRRDDPARRLPGARHRHHRPVGRGAGRPRRRPRRPPGGRGRRRCAAELRRHADALRRYRRRPARGPASRSIAMVALMWGAFSAKDRVTGAADSGPSAAVMVADGALDRLPAGRARASPSAASFVDDGFARFAKVMILLRRAVVAGDEPRLPARDAACCGSSIPVLIALGDRRHDGDGLGAAT